MRKSSSLPIIIVALLILIVAGSAGTFAWFTTTATMTTDFTAGKIELTKCLPDGNLTWVDMLPGVWMDQKSFQIKNTGINPPTTLKYELVASKTSETVALFGDKIVVEIRKGLSPGVLVYTGLLKDISFTVASIAPNVTDNYYIKPKLDDPTGNTYQLANCKFDIKVIGTQLINPGFNETSP